MHSSTFTVHNNKTDNENQAALENFYEYIFITFFIATGQGYVQCSQSNVTHE